MKHDQKLIDEAKAKINVYNLAADAIEKYGHAKCALQDDQGRMCLYGAINFAMQGDAIHPTHESHNKLKALAPLIPIGETSMSYFPVLITTSNPVTWNNAPERTQAEVVALLRKAAQVLA